MHNKAHNWIEEILKLPKSKMLCALKTRDNAVASMYINIQEYKDIYSVTLTDITPLKVYFEVISHRSDDQSYKHNWQAILKNMEKEVHRAKRYKESVSFVMFALVNMSGSLSAMDKPNKKLSSLIEDIIDSVIRPTDSFGIWEDNRYIIVAPHTNKEGVEKLLQRLLNILRTNFYLRSQGFYYKLCGFEYKQGDKIGLIVNRLKNMIDMTLKSDGNSIKIG